MDMLEMTAEELLGSLNEVERKNAPKKLYLAGDVGLVHAGPRVSVVGSRNASPEGLARTRAITTALVERRITVVSGLAEGVDAVAHETAMSAGGRTIAVIGTPLEVAYPEKNQMLQESLMRKQLVVSQFPPGYPFHRKNFPIRNRTMALLSDATVIVEAGDKSGTLHQGWEALRLGRLLFIMETVTQDSKLEWPKEMIRYGAQVLSRDNLAYVLEEIPESGRGDRLDL